MVYIARVVWNIPKFSNSITYLVNAIQRDWPLHSKEPSKFAHFPCCPSKVLHVKGLCKSSLLFVYIRWVHIIKYRQNCHSYHFHALNYLCNFIQAPCRRCIVFWENNNRNSQFFYCFQELRLNRFSSLKPFIISKGENTRALQSSI